MVKKAFVILLAALLAGPAFAQNQVVGVRAYNSAATVNPGDSTNSAVRVNIVAGAIGGATSSSPLYIAPSTVSSANNTGSQVSLSGASATVLASYATRHYASICSAVANSAVIYLKFGATATSSNFILSPGMCWNSGNSVYTGVIDAIVASGTQVVSVVEW